MRLIYKVILAVFFYSFIFHGCMQKPDTSYKEEKVEIENFMNNYKRLLQNAKFDSVALLYVDTGFVLLGNGQMDIQIMDSIKASYARMPKTPNDFSWEKMRIDILSKRSAFVTSFFYWDDKNKADAIKQSYTGVFIKTDNGWKIIHEHESLDVATMTKIIKESEKNSK
jgi:ketosteroid isomerase-like protein